MAPCMMWTVVDGDGDGDLDFYGLQLERELVNELEVAMYIIESPLEWFYLF